MNQFPNTTRREFPRTLNAALLFSFATSVTQIIKFKFCGRTAKLSSPEKAKPYRVLACGFSVIELLVVLAIFAALSGTLFVNYGKFNVGASLDNLVHQIALVVRQAQVYGVSVSQTSSQQFKGYGAYFSVATPNDQKTFIMFSDRAPADKLYTPAIPPGQQDNCDGTSECVERITIQTGDMIDQLVAYEKTAPGSTIPLKEVHIVFTRPNPDASITGYRLDNGIQIQSISDVAVHIVSPRGGRKKTIIWSTGQIAVE